ncbi:hypothetical protein MFLAVUS_011411 [Mucor flavus]|uniref:Glutamine amidotransferase domain-containing protein n=1 Tax=Mucor flavus TaxID=439312 RepID=A0ABP9ZFG4_9FUNG
MNHTKLHIALLKTDEPMPQLVDELGEYHEQFDAVFDKAADIEHLSIHWDVFDVINKQEYPSFEDIKNHKYNAILLTGSDCSAEGQDPWILKLVDFLKKVQTDHVKDVKLIGICFGHQIILRAAGGKSDVNEAGWEIGWVAIKLNKEGQRFFKTAKETLRINQFHKDHVIVLPKGFKTLAFTEHSTPTHIVVSDNLQCLSIQGHPEFSRDTMIDMIKIRIENGALEKHLAEAALESLENAYPEMEDVWFAEKVLDFILNKLE